MNLELVSNGTGPMLFKTKMFHDQRGYFLEVFNAADLKTLGLQQEFVQDNVSYSKKDVLRGLHFQTNPDAQGKYVTCLKGEILDVVVDVRKGSPEYGKYKKFTLKSDDAHILYVPAGFAHGFLVKSEEALVMYKTTSFYAPQSDSGVIWNDPTLNIDWGIDNPILADKDKALPKLEDAKNNFEYGLI